MKKKINWIVLSLTIISLNFCWSVSADIIDRIVAIVDNDIVTLVQLNKATAPYIQNIESSGYLDEKKSQMIKATNEKMLNALIDQSLTHQEATKYNVEVSEGEVDNAVENVKRSKSLSQEDFVEALGQEGISLKEYRENIEKQILQNKLTNYMVRSKVIITESEIKKYYETNVKKYSGIKKYHLRNILMDSETALQEVKKKLDAKEEYKGIARFYSIAPNALEGGDLGWFDIASFPENVKEAIYLLSKGQYTNVISTSQGFQIFYLEDIVVEGSKTYEQAYDEINDILYREQVKEKFETWLESLKKKAYIKIML